MTAYEASDLLNGAISNQLGNQASFMTIVSAYLVVAYTVGMQLTKYQVWFISFTFCLFVLMDLVGAASLISWIDQYNFIRAELIPGAESKVHSANGVFLITAGVRLILVTGSLIFMWQVRHAKTE